MRYIRLIPVGLVVIASTLMAAPGRLDNLAENLSRAADSLAAEGYRGFLNRDRGNRRDVEALFLAQQFSAGASLLQRLVRERRPDSELRDSVAILTDEARSSSGFGFGQRSWQDMLRTLDDISRELHTNGRERIDDSHPSGRITGRMHWRGKVDDRVQIYVQGMHASVKAVSGHPISNTDFNFTSALPQHPATVEGRKTKGRGSVEIIQQPARSNDYTAVIEIYDSKGGSEDYEFELTW